MNFRLTFISFLVFQNIIFKIITITYFTLQGFTEEGEESEILINHDKSLEESKQSIVKRKLHYINLFDHERPAVVRKMCDLTSRVFEHLDITSTIDVYHSIAYIQRLLKGAALKNTRRY